MKEIMKEISSSSSGDHGYTWTPLRAEHSLSSAVAHARLWTRGDEAAIHVITTPCMRVVVTASGIFAALT